MQLHNGIAAYYWKIAQNHELGILIPDSIKVNNDAIWISSDNFDHLTRGVCTSLTAHWVGLVVYQKSGDKEPVLTINLNDPALNWRNISWAHGLPQQQLDYSANVADVNKTEPFHAFEGMIWDESLLERSNTHAEELDAWRLLRYYENKTPNWSILQAYMQEEESQKIPITNYAYLPFITHPATSSHACLLVLRTAKKYMQAYQRSFVVLAMDVG